MIMRNDSVGRFFVAIELANNADLVRAEAGDLPANKVRRDTIQGLVDSGATRLVLPQAVADRLGLRATSTIKVQYAVGRTAERPLVSQIVLRLNGRESVFNAVIEPDRDTALVGAIVLEDLDLVVDCTQQRLVPRDPKQIISEIE